MEEDLELVNAVLARDRKATAEFVNRWADSVYGYIRSRLFPFEDQVDDVVQEVFLTAWEKLGSYRGEAPLRGWLIGIARHKVEDHYRARLRQPAGLEDTEGAEPRDEGLGIDERIDRAALEGRAREILRELPEAYAAVLLWRYWERASAREIAEKTGRTEKAVERLLARAREQFKRRWDRQ